MPKKLPRKDQPSLFDALEPTDELGTNGHLQDTTSTFTDNLDRKSTRLNSSHSQISYAVFCLKKKKKKRRKIHHPDNYWHKVMASLGPKRQMTLARKMTSLAPIASAADPLDSPLRHATIHWLR